MNTNSLQPLHKGDNVQDNTYPVEPMAAFYAAVTALENGSVGEVELNFNTMTSDTDITMTMVIRREVRSFPTATLSVQREED